MTIPHNFQPTVSPHATTYQRMGNPQTDALLQKLNLPHIHTIPYTPQPQQSPYTSHSNTTTTTNNNNTVLIPSQTLTTNNITKKPMEDENEIDLDDNDDNDDNLVMKNQSLTTTTPILHPVDDENEINLEDNDDEEEEEKNLVIQTNIPSKRVDIQKEISTPPTTIDENEIDLENEEEEMIMNQAKKIRMDKNE